MATTATRVTCDDGAGEMTGATRLNKTPRMNVEWTEEETLHIISLRCCESMSFRAIAKSLNAKYRPGVTDEAQLRKHGAVCNHYKKYKKEASVNLLLAPGSLSREPQAG
jgi:hypothetical protein